MLFVCPCHGNHIEVQSECSGNRTSISLIKNPQSHPRLGWLVSVYTIRTRTRYGMTRFQPPCYITFYVPPSSCTLLSYDVACQRTFCEVRVLDIGHPRGGCRFSNSNLNTFAMTCSCTSLRFTLRFNVNSPRGRYLGLAALGQ